ncbi:MAG: CHRD domain-containing protein [Actinomycetota bacterium]
MKLRLFIAFVGLGALLFAGLTGPTQATNDTRSFRATLTGYEEPPSISTPASGTFRARLSSDGTTLNYELTYSNIQNAFMAHIHLGQRGVNGGVSAFLCGGSLPASDKPPCPPTGGTVSDSIDAADVIGPSGQGISAGEFDELLAAMRAGFTYVNVHTQMAGAAPGPGNLPGGEIRGQIR